MSRKAKGGFSVSGGGIESEGYANTGHAISRALTAAGQATSETTYYIRDATGTRTAWVERQHDGVINVYTTR